MARSSDPRSRDKGQDKTESRGESTPQVPFLEKARQALASKDREVLLLCVAENPYLLDVDQDIRRSWIQEVDTLQGKVVAYERVLRYYQEMGAPPIEGYAPELREQIGPGEKAAKYAREELTGIGDKFLRAALRRGDPWKDDASAIKARKLLQEAHKEMRRFFGSVRKEATKYRRPWNQLLREERIWIVGNTPEAGIVSALSSKLWGMFPEAKWRLAQYDPYFYYVEHPEEFVECRHLKPSELAWKALAQLMGTGEATLKRWVHRQARPRTRT